MNFLMLNFFAFFILFSCSKSSKNNSQTESFNDVVENTNNESDNVVDNTSNEPDKTCILTFENGGHFADAICLKGNTIDLQFCTDVKDFIFENSPVRGGWDDSSLTFNEETETCPTSVPGFMSLPVNRSGKCENVTYNSNDFTYTYFGSSGYGNTELERLDCETILFNGNYTDL